jgi:hypothetical protein
VSGTKGSALGVLNFNTQILYGGQNCEGQASTKRLLNCKCFIKMQISTFLTKMNDNNKIKTLKFPVQNIKQGMSNKVNENKQEMLQYKF